MPALAQLGSAARTIVVPIFAHVSIRTRRSRCKKVTIDKRWFNKTAVVKAVEQRLRRNTFGLFSGEETGSDRSGILYLANLQKSQSYKDIR
jgi:hypothetical protein